MKKKKRTKPKGSGRKKGEPTKVIRVPLSKLSEINSLLLTHPDRQTKTKK